MGHNLEQIFYSKNLADCLDDTPLKGLFYMHCTLLIRTDIMRICFTVLCIWILRLSLYPSEKVAFSRLDHICHTVAKEYKKHVLLPKKSYEKNSCSKKAFSSLKNSGREKAISSLFLFLYYNILDVLTSFDL